MMDKPEDALAAVKFWWWVSLTGSSLDRTLPACRTRGTKGMPVGLYRERGGWGDEHSVRVRYDDGEELDLPEGEYKALL
jgi:hypothetical protein